MHIISCGTVETLLFVTKNQIYLIGRRMNPTLNMQQKSDKISDKTNLGFSQNCKKTTKFGVWRLWDSEVIMTFFTNSVTALKTVVTAIGAGVAVWGIINLLEGYGNDNPGAKSQGIKQLMAGGGIVIIAQTVIPQLTSLFS